MKHPQIAQQIIALKDADLKLRDELIQRNELYNGYHPEMEQLHIENAKELQRIIDAIGFPNIPKVGKEASEASWLVTQHSISVPSLMKMYLELLKEAVNDGEASAIHLAYLTDRVLSFQDQPQLYGTAFDWDNNGIMNPKLYDDLDKVNARRSSLGMNTIEEQTKIIRAQVTKEQEDVPMKLKQRQLDYDLWRKKVGWIL